MRSVRARSPASTSLLADIARDHALSVAAGCPQASILLAGYSQGAEVVIRAVDSLSADTTATISVALLGNPSFVVRATGDLDLNTKLRYFGIRPRLTGQKYTLRPDVLPRTIDICAASDPICAYHLSEIPGSRRWTQFALSLHVADLRRQHLDRRRCGVALVAPLHPANDAIPPFESGNIQVSSSRAVASRHQRSWPSRPACRSRTAINFSTSSRARGWSAGKWSAPVDFW